MEDFWLKKLRAYQQSLREEDSEGLPEPTLTVERKNILSLPDIVAQQSAREHEDYGKNFSVNLIINSHSRLCLSKDVLNCIATIF